MQGKNNRALVMALHWRRILPVAGTLPDLACRSVTALPRGTRERVLKSLMYAFSTLVFTIWIPKIQASGTRGKRVSLGRSLGDLTNEGTSLLFLAGIARQVSVAIISLLAQKRQF